MISYYVLYIIREYGEISVCKGQDWKSALRQHCMKNRCDSSWKSLHKLRNTPINHCLWTHLVSTQFRLKLYHAKRSRIWKWFWNASVYSGTKLIWNRRRQREKTVMLSGEGGEKQKSFLENVDTTSSGLKSRGTISTRIKRLHVWWH